MSPNYERGKSAAMFSFTGRLARRYKQHVYGAGVQSIRIPGSDAQVCIEVCYRHLGTMNSARGTMEAELAARGPGVS